MSRTDTEQLVVTLEARIRDFEKKFDRANRTASKNFKAIERRADKFGTRIEKSMSKAAKGASVAMKGFLAGVAGGIAVGGIDGLIRGLGETAKSVAEIGNQAKRAGLSSKAFQELGFVADQNRIPVDALVDGMKELNLRADEFIVTGKGPAADAFNRLGYSADDLKRKLKDPSALLVEIIGRLEEFDQAAQIRIADEIFGGTGGERFVELLDRGAASIRAQIKEANDLGLILDEKLIAQADEIDRKFQIIAKTIGTRVKAAVVEVATALGTWIDGFNEFQNQADRTIQLRLSDIYAKRDNIQSSIASGDLSERQIGKLKNELSALTDEALRLRDILDRRAGYDENFIYKAGEEADDATPAVNGLNSALNGTGDASQDGARGINSYADAIRALKDEIPGLASELAKLDAQARIDGVYRAALAKATSPEDVIAATRLHQEARAALASKDAREAASKSFLDLIAYSEGTDKGRGYNETLGHGAFTGGDRNLVGMTLDQIDTLQSQMLASPNNSFNSSALGRYQITRTTLRGLRDKLGLSGDDYFDASMQDRLAEELMRQRGNDVSGLRNEWEGLRKIDPSLISGSYDQTVTGIPPIDPGLADQRRETLDMAREQANAYQQIVQGAQRFTQEQQLEQQALGMTQQQAAALRYEQDMLNQAQQAGITLTPQQRAELQQLAQGMAQVEQATSSAAQSQQQLQAMQGFLSQSIGGFFTGIITGSQSAEDALRQLLARLAEAALQAALFGSGPLGALFGGGGLLGGLFGFSSGGPVMAATGGLIRGPGTGTSDSIPAMLSDGEFVIRARAAQKHRRLLEMINAGALPGFADGGLASAHPITMPRMAGARSERSAVTINAPISINGSAGTPEQNTDLAKKMRREMEGTMRGVVVDEMRRQMRPGNMIGRI